MKVFLDFEFIEGFHKPMFGKRRHFIDMISIGAVKDSGDTFYAISSEYRYKDADEWVKTNVIIPAYIDRVHGDQRNHCDSSNFHKHFGRPVNIIANQFMSWLGEAYDLEFYGYYADYDWVLFCSMFGRMIDLPKGFPMYCRDLKQMFDSKISDFEIRSIGYDKAVERLKNKEGYPPQSEEHNALADAKWNKKLYEFLKTVGK